MNRNYRQSAKELAELKEQEKSYKAKWQSEKSLMDIIQQNKVEIENLKFEADKAERRETMAKLQRFAMANCRNCIRKLKIPEKIARNARDTAMIKEEVDAEDIADGSIPLDRNTCKQK